MRRPSQLTRDQMLELDTVKLRSFPPTCELLLPLL